MADSKHLSLVGHLAEFRSRLIASLIWFVLWFCLGIFLVDPFYHLVTQFLDQPLLALGPNEILWLYVKVASLVALSASRLSNKRSCVPFIGTCQQSFFALLWD